jgi:hypothetical protein
MLDMMMNEKLLILKFSQICLQVWLSARIHSSTASSYLLQVVSDDSKLQIW